MNMIAKRDVVSYPLDMSWITPDFTKDEVKQGIRILRANRLAELVAMESTDAIEAEISWLCSEIASLAD